MPREPAVLVLRVASAPAAHLAGTEQTLAHLEVGEGQDVRRVAAALARIGLGVTEGLAPALVVVAACKSPPPVAPTASPDIEQSIDSQAAAAAPGVGSHSRQRWPARAKEMVQARPTRPVPTLSSFLSIEPTLRGFS